MVQFFITDYFWQILVIFEFEKSGNFAFIQKFSIP